MKKISMKSGFTMIELIFVIVIIGILAAVALPKFAGMAKQAHVSNLGQFQSSLNNTVGPTAWGKVAVNGEGNLSNLPAGEQNLSVYAQIPKEFSKNGNSSDANLSNTGNSANIQTGTIDVSGNTVPTTCNGGAKPYQLEKGSGTGSNAKPFKAKIGTDIYDVAVCNGTQTTAPKFYIYKTN